MGVTCNCMYLCDGGNGGTRRRGTAAILCSQLRHSALRLVGPFFRLLEFMLHFAILGQVNRSQLLLLSQQNLR